jgi:hypothetical protein
MPTGPKAPQYGKLQCPERKAQEKLCYPHTATDINMSAAYPTLQSLSTLTHLHYQLNTPR